MERILDCTCIVCFQCNKKHSLCGCTAIIVIRKHAPFKKTVLLRSKIARVVEYIHAKINKDAVQGLSGNFNVTLTTWNQEKGEYTYFPPAAKYVGEVVGDKSVIVAEVTRA